MRESWDRLGDASYQAGTLEFALSEGTLATKFQRAPNPSAPLLIWLHGAMDRQRHTPPFFSGPAKEFAQTGHQLAVSDPMLHRHEALRNGWYIGDERLNLQAELAAFFMQVARVLGVRRVIYLGGSGGGFASLYFSLQHPGSCAIVVQPQTNLEFFPNARTYLSLCWPGRTLSDLPGTVCTDVCQHYAKGFRNAVVYIQGIADRSHFRNHLTPFQCAVRDHPESTAIFHVDFWGETGHAVVPQPIIRSWIKAALVARTFGMTDLLEAHHRIRQRATTPPSSRPTTSAADSSASVKTLSAADVSMADRLRDFHLSIDDERQM